MSPPLPFGFMKGLVRIYKIVPDKPTKNGPRTFVYYQDSVTQEKAKWSTGDPDYIDVLNQLNIPGNFNVSWAGSKPATLSIEPADQ
jgi:hypothetical protein